MAEKYKLTYFNARGRAEPIRLLFAYGKISFEDVRINGEDWSELKPKMPWGSVPILEVDGKVISQSYAIIRFLAKKLDLYGADPFECAKVDEYAYAVEDLRAELMKYQLTKDAELKKVLLSTQIPNYMEKFSKLTLLPGSSETGPYLFGSKVTFADILLANVLDAIETTLDTDILMSYPVMKSLKESVFDIPSIRDYVESRPSQ